MSTQPRSTEAIVRVCYALLTLGVSAAVGAGFFLGWGGQWIPTTVLSGVLVLTHLRPHRLTGVGGTETVQPDELLLVPLFLVASPLGVMGALLVSAVWQGTSNGLPHYKRAFNAGQMLLATALGLASAHGVAAVLPSGALYRDLGALVGAGVFGVVSNLAVSAMMAFVTRGSIRKVLSVRDWDLLPLGAAVSVGTMGVVLYQIHPALLILLLFPLVLLYRAQALAVAKEHSRRRMELMYQAAERIHASDDVAEVRSELVVQAQGVLGAVSAALGQAGEGDLAEPFSEEEVVVSGRIGGGAWDEEDTLSLRSLTATASMALERVKLSTRMRTVTESQSESVVAVDRNLTVLFANPAALLLSGSAAPVGRSLAEMLSLDVLGKLQEAVQAGERCTGEGMLTRGETSVPVAYSVSPVEGDSEFDGAVVVLRDITEERAYREHLARIAFHDPLTDLANRQAILEQVSAMLQEGSVAVAFLNLDRFRLVNDSYGHSVGDDLLCQVARRIEAAGGKWTAGRISGDEFCVVTSSRDEALAVGKAVVAALEEPFSLEESTIHVCVSVGVVVSSEGSSAEDVLAAGDAAADEVKRMGGNAVVVRETSSAVSGARVRLETEEALRRGLEQGEFVLHYQPLTDSASGMMTGVEALVRWERDGVLVSPFQFIPVAEESGLIVPLGTWVLEEACRQVNEWNASRTGRPPLYVSVNVAMKQFVRPEIVSVVRSALEKTGLAPRLLCLEVTEGALMEDTTATIETLNQLRGLGLRVAIDDFGTGYSSLSYLQRFPLDVVKVDQSFVREMGKSRAAVEIVTAVVRLSQAVGMGSVAEGVETEEQRDALIALGCGILQGYLYSKPVPGEELLSYWDREHSFLPYPREADVLPRQSVGSESAGQ